LEHRTLAAAAQTAAREGRQRLFLTNEAG